MSAQGPTPLQPNTHKTSRRTDDLSAEDIQYYDAALRTVLQHMPSPMLRTPGVDHGAYQMPHAVNCACFHPLRRLYAGPNAAEPPGMQCSLWTSIHNRILRIHRPGLARDFSTEEYERSTRASIASAKE